MQTTVFTIFPWLFSQAEPALAPPSPFRSFSAKGEYGLPPPFPQRIQVKVGTHGLFLAVSFQDRTLRDRPSFLLKKDHDDFSHPYIQEGSSPPPSLLFLPPPEEQKSSRGVQCRQIDSGEGTRARFPFPLLSFPCTIGRAGERRVGIDPLFPSFFPQSFPPPPP